MALDRHGDPSPTALERRHRTLPSSIDQSNRRFRGPLGKDPGQGEAACVSRDAAVVGLQGWS